MGVNMNEQDKQESITENPDQLPFIEQAAEKHPSTEMFMLRQAVDEALTHTQRELWAMRAYDRFTETEIAKKLRISQQSVSKRLAVIENKIVKWCEKRKNTYRLIKLTQSIYGKHDEKARLDYLVSFYSPKCLFLLLDEGRETGGISTRADRLISAVGYPRSRH